ncbi:YbaB/EbfC family nucleoid-associated protein [Micromonospora rubida]|uniref:YbaB/EbfC family nucleoid-associated protein n=1 Tax=Micromonospora rubida TaxID=2697657 RepID=A0ABW7SK15_9ACTN
MASGFEAAINEMLAELAQQRESMTRLQQGMASVTGSATAPKRQVSVVVDAQGDITELKFLGQSYRSMAASELSSVIMSTIKEARRDARARLADRAGDVGVAGANVGDLVGGEADWGAALTDAFTVPQPFLDLLQRPPTDLVDGIDLDTGSRRSTNEGETPTRDQEPGDGK